MRAAFVTRYRASSEERDTTNKLLIQIIWHIKMFRLAPVLLLLLVALPWMSLADEAIHEEGHVEEGHVLVLDASNFTEVVKEHPFIVVEFYAPWCGHCKRLAPEYEKAAAILKTHEPPIILAKVDANEETNKALAGEYGIRGFPTLKIIENKGTVVRDYKGPREVDGIVSYLKKQVGPPSDEIISTEQGEKLVAEADFLVVGVFLSYDSEEYRDFTSIASELRSDYEFRHTLDASFLPTKAAVLSGPAIRVFKKFDEGFNDLKEFKAEAVKKFLDEVSIPLVVLFNKDPVQREYLSKIFANPQDSKAFLFVDAKDEGVEEIKDAFGKLAKEYKGKGVRFLIADTEDGLNALQYFGARKEKLPSIVIQGKDEKKYILEEAQTGKIASWLNDYFDGKVSEFLKSEPVPEKNDEPVKIVVLDTFETMVLKSGKTVLLEFYAPWCGHCKKLAPVLDEVAVSFQSDPDVLIAKIDATANDITDKRFDVKGFPTLYLHSSAGKITLYEGDRSKEDLISFININKDSVGKSEIIKEPEVDVGVSKDEL